MWINGKEVENNIKSIRSAMVQLTNQLNRMEIGSEEYVETSRKLRELKSIYDEHCRSLRTTGEELAKNTERTKENIVAAGGASAAIQGLVSVYQKAVSSVQEYVDVYAKIDDAMVSVSKYTGLTKDEVKALNEELQKMDTRTSIEKLNALAADAGRLGITSKAAIKDFVEAADIINIALGEDLGEDAVKNIGKMAQMFGETETMGLRGAMIATASAVNTLAQSSSASEPYVMDFSARLAGVANTAGLTQAQVMGIASAMDQNMAQVEKSATSVQKVMMDMMGKTEKYARLLGMTGEEFKKLVDTDMNTAFLSVIDKFKEINASGPSALAETLADLKLKGAGVQETLLTLAKHTDQLREAQQLATQAYADGNSVINEAAAANGSAVAQMEKMNKQIEVQKARLGEELYPIYKKIINGTLSLASGTVSLVKQLKTHAEILVLIGALFSKRIAQFAVLTAKQIAHTAAKLKDIVVTKAQTVATNLSTIKLGAECIAHDLAAKKIRLHTAAQEMLMLVMKETPWGLVLSAVGTIATAFVTLTKNTRDAKKAAEEFNTEVAKEQAEAQYLFEKLKNTEKGTDDYREALEKLKEKYPEIIQKHLDEKGALRDVEQAYKDVIVQIKAKIAEQLKEQQSNAAITKNIEDQTEALDKIREKLRKQGKSESEVSDIVSTIQNMTASGSSSADIRKKLRESYGLETKSGVQAGYLFDIGRQIDKMTESQNRMNKSLEETDKRFQPFIEDGKMASDEIAKIDSKIAELQKQLYGENRREVQRQIDDLKKLKQQKIDTAKAGDGTKSDSPDTPHSPSGGGNSNKSDKTLTARENFQKKLQQMEAKAQADTLSGWEKTKQEIVNKYDELLAEAKELYGEDSKTFAKVQQMKVDAIAAAGQQYLQKQGKTLEDFSQKIQEWVKETAPEEGNEILNAVLGTEQKWAQRFTDAQSQLQTLMELRAQFVADNQDTAALDRLIDKLGAEMNRMADAEAADIQKTLEKYQAQTDDFIKSEQKSVTDATLSETERQKNAIREKYRLEIEHIEKAIAARIAAYGEDDPEVKQLREKIKLLNQLKGQQLDNADKAAASSGSKSVWQQLAEFDWSKMNENWQSALGLMSQGLQEFANAAFDIYGSIAQIQDNMMEAELQKTQEAYDAETAALQRQLNQGVISQKAYDARMQKLNEEKDKKEKKLKHEQFAREKAADIIKATVTGILAAMQSLANGGGVPWGLIPMAISVATTAAQIAAIASQPNPYAKGGYIRGRQYAVMGEQGDEWVASSFTYLAGTPCSSISVMPVSFSE